MKISVYGHKELNFVELNITGTEDTYVKCDPESRYLDCVVFNVFTECFEKANQLYEYYDATKYNARYIVILRNHMQMHLSKLEQIKTLEGFQEYISSKLLGREFLLALVKSDKNWTEHWAQYHKRLVIVSKEILNLVDFVIDEDRILWVIGY